MGKTAHQPLDLGAVALGAFDFFLAVENQDLEFLTALAAAVFIDGHRYLRVVALKMVPRAALVKTAAHAVLHKPRKDVQPNAQPACTCRHPLRDIMLI